MSIQDPQVVTTKSACKPQPVRAIFGAIILVSGAQSALMAAVFLLTDLANPPLWALTLPLGFAAVWHLAYRSRRLAGMPAWGAAVIAGLVLQSLGGLVMNSPLTERDLLIEVEAHGEVELICIGDSCASFNPVSRWAAFQAEARGRSVDVMVHTTAGFRSHRVGSRSGCIELSWSSLNPATAVAPCHATE